MKPQINPSTPLYDLLIECCRHEPSNIKLEEYAEKIINWNAFLESAYAHGVYPVVAKALKSIAVIPEFVKLTLKSTNLEIARRNMSMTVELLRVMKLFQENNISALAIKGPTLSQIIHGDITTRQYADIDILVEEDHLYNAACILTEKDYTFDYSIDFTKNKGLLKATKDITLSKKGPNIDLELHWRLFSGRLFKKSNIDLFRDNSQFITIYQQKVTTLDNTVLLLYLLLHGSKHLWERLEWIVDIDRLVRSHEIDWEIMSKNTKIMQIEPMIQLGCAVAFDLFETPFPDDTLKYFTHNDAIINAQLQIKNDLFSNRIFEEGRIMNTVYYLGMGAISQPWFEYVFRFFRYTKNDVFTVNLPNILTPAYHLIHLYNSAHYRLKSLLYKRKSND